MSIDTAPVETVTENVGTVSPAALAAALTAVLPHTIKKSENLPALSAVKIQSSADGETLTLIATDRYTLATFRLDWAGGPVDVMLDVDDAKALLAFAKAAGKLSRIALTVTSDRIEAFDFERRSTYRLLTDHRFPSWESLIPDATNPNPIDSIAVNPVYLARFAKAVGTRGGVPMRLTFSGGPIRVDIGTEFTGLIMPVRIRS